MYLTAVDIFNVMEESSVGKWISCPQWVPVWKWHFFNCSLLLSGVKCLMVQCLSFSQEAWRSLHIADLQQQTSCPCWSCSGLHWALWVSVDRRPSSANAKIEASDFFQLCYETQQGSQSLTQRGSQLHPLKSSRGAYWGMGHTGKGWAAALGLQSQLQPITGVKFILRTFGEFTHLCVSYSLLNAL